MIRLVTYLQCDSPRGDDTQSPPFLQGLGEHDTKPVTTKNLSYFICRNKIFNRGYGMTSVIHAYNITYYIINIQIIYINTSI